MIQICGVCDYLIKSDATPCPGCGADSKSFQPVLVVIKVEDRIFRIHDLPFQGTRSWAKDHFRVVSDPEGNPSYKYMSRSSPMFEILCEPEGFILISDLPVLDDVNHWRVNDIPVASPGIRIEKSGQTLQLWSGKRQEIVMALQIFLESY